jgi:hydrogenase-1 operon protein HyaE
MRSPLEKLLHGAGLAVTPETIVGFLALPGPALLLFTGDPAQRPEAQDVAVVASQLARHMSGLWIGVVTGAAPDAVKLRFKVSVVPTVVFLLDGEVKATLDRLRDWSVYARTAEQAFGERRKLTA